MGPEIQNSVEEASAGAGRLTQSDRISPSAKQYLEIRKTLSSVGDT